MFFVDPRSDYMKKYVLFIIALLFQLSSIIAQTAINRPWTKTLTDGLSYILLQQNVPLDEQLNSDSTIYDIRYNYNLNGDTIIIPSHCVLQLEGGTINNGVLVLSSFCSIIGKGANIPLLHNINIILNKCCEINNIGFLNVGLTNSILSFKLSDSEEGRFWGLPNIIVQNVRFDVRNQTHVGTILTASADVQSQVVHSAGCSGFIFNNIDVYGNLGDGFVFRGIYNNSWLNDIVFNNVTQYGSTCGWNFNIGHNGFIQHVAITNCSYQHEEETTYAIDAKNVSDLTISGTRFWDFTVANSAVCRFDTGCWGIYMSNMNSSDAVRPYTIIGGDVDQNTHGRIFITNELAYRGNVEKYLSPSSDVTVTDFHKLPNGLYYLSKSSANDFKMHWGIRLGDDYKDDALLKIEKRLSCLFVEVVCSKRVNEYTTYNRGQLQTIATTTINNTPVKYLWNINVSTDLISNSLLERIEPFDGESHLVSTYNKPYWWNGAEWIDGNGYIRGLNKGVAQSAPSNLSGYTKDIGYPFFVIEQNKQVPTWWNGSKWIEVDGAKALTSRSGTSSERPTGTDVYTGFMYFDTTIGKPIWYKGNGIWVDANGNNV